MYVFGVAGLEGKLFCQLFLAREAECTPLPLTSFPLMGNGGACAYGQIADALCVGLLMFVNAFMCVSVEFKEYWDHYKKKKTVRRRKTIWMLRVKYKNMEKWK